MSLRERRGRRKGSGIGLNEEKAKEGVNVRPIEQRKKEIKTETVSFQNESKQKKNDGRNDIV